LTEASNETARRPIPWLGRVDEDAAFAFARATNDDNDLYARGQAVPPLFTAALILPAQQRMPHFATLFPPIRGSRGSVHGEHDVFFRGPVLPGMELQLEADLYGATQTRGGALVTQRYLFSDTDGAPLVEHFWSNLHLGGTVDADTGARITDHSFPEAARAQPVESRTIAVDRDQTFRYAGVASDHIGHAIDDEIARSEGYPSKILQGLCTFAMCSAVLVDIGAEREPRRLRRLAGRFSAPALPGRDLTIVVYDAGHTHQGDTALAFEAIQDGVTVIKHGRAEVARG
jgi:acyl dehydratase